MPSLVVHYFYDAIIIFMIAVKRQLIENPEANKHSYGHTYGQATYINKRRGLVFRKSEINIPGGITDLNIFSQFFYRYIDIPTTGRSFKTAGKITEMNTPT